MVTSVESLSLNRTTSVSSTCTLARMTDRSAMVMRSPVSREKVPGTATSPRAPPSRTTRPQIALPHGDIDDPAGNIGTDIHRSLGLDLSAGGDGADQVPPGNLLQLDLGAGVLLPVYPERGGRAGHDHHDCHQQPDFGPTRHV